jgi:hypothetical protein
MDRLYHRARRTVRNAILSATIIGLIPVLGIVVPNARADDDDRGCTLASLKGAFGFKSAGSFRSPVDDSDVTAVGRIVFDGRGHVVSVRQTQSLEGTISRAADTGTYTVESDCTGSYTLLTGARATADFVIVSGADEIFWIQTNPDLGVTVSAIAKKQFPRHKEGKEGGKDD